MRHCLLGATNEELGKMFDVSLKTIEHWLNVDPIFLGAVKEGREEADANVARSLYQRACGASHPETHVSSYQGDVTLTPLTRHYPPDTGAAINWLSNRQRAKWRTPAALSDLPDDGGDAPLPVKVTIDFKDARRKPKKED